MCKVSIIIPVYNAENYLERCLDSVCNQTLKDIEIICVDDCSTDNSRKILNDYAKKYPKLKVICHEVNGGESKARNTGLENATGEYLGFVDNDDEIDLNFYEKLYEKAIETNSDVVKGEAHQINYDGSEIFVLSNERIREQNHKLFFMFYWWCAIYKRSLVEKFSIRFLEGYPLGGDVLFLNEVMLNCNKLELIDDVFYHYHRREDSGDSKILTLAKIKSVVEILEMIVDNTLKYNKVNEYPEYAIKNILNWCLNSVLMYFYRCEDVEALKFSVKKASSIYNKISNYFDREKVSVFEICIDLLKKNDVKALEEFFIKNDTYQKMLMANLRYKHLKSVKNKN